MNSHNKNSKNFPKSSFGSRLKNVSVKMSVELTLNSVKVNELIK